MPVELVNFENAPEYFDESRAIEFANSAAHPAAVVNEIDPPIDSILSRTTSMPTPRLEMLATFGAVEKSGANINRPTSSSERSLASAADTKPLATALSRMRSKSGRRPSSETLIVM